uniref:Uncharacterized protein n=1 Tax=viral metagenome TaxID=1070528 RepID=A0A6M3KMB8_9ZZZZ
MATVGELCERHKDETGGNFWANPVATLQELGIWDAEVYEMQATSGPGWMDLVQPVPSDDDADVPALDLPEGQVRVIVLPCPEKENECTGKENE